MYKKAIDKYIKCVQIASTRVCGVILQASSNFRFLFFVCVYMPCDTYSDVHVNDDFSEVIEVIDCTMHDYECDAYIICGDFNTSFERANTQSRFLLDFISRNNVYMA